MKNLAFILLLFICFCQFSNAQNSLDYDDVLVIANTLSPESMEITEYFQSKRNIPAENIIHIESTSNETIDEFEFDELRTQIKAKLALHPNLSSLNYIVTTKGVPLKINDNCKAGDISFCKSVDEELIVILSEDVIKQTSNPGKITNPYFDSEDHFSREKFNLFLVTRLDGYTVHDVKALIDRSIEPSEVALEESNFVFDVVSNENSGLVNFFLGMLASPYESTADKDLKAILNSELTPSDQVDDVIAYYLISSELKFDHPDPTFVKGGIAELAYCKSASTFTLNEDKPIAYAADFIRNGATAVSAYTHVTYISPMTNVTKLYDRYFELDSKYNLAESFYGSKKQLRMHRTVIGDPKSKLQFRDSNNSMDTNLNNIAIYPNPTNGLVSFDPPKNTSGKLLIYNNQGVNIQTISFSRGKVNVDLRNYPKGVYNFTFSSENGIVTKRVLLF